MKVLIFSDHFMPEMGPPAAHVYERAKIWARDGHCITVITNVPNSPQGCPYEGYENKWRQVEYIDGIRVVRVKTYMTANGGITKRGLDYFSYFLSSTIQSFLESRPDVIMSTSPHLFVPAAGVMCSIFRRVPHVFEIRDLWPHSIVATTSLAESSFIYRMLEFLELSLYRFSKKIISLSPAFVEKLVNRGVSIDKIRVVISGANLELFSPAPKNTKFAARQGLANDFVVGYLGTIGLAHGLENVIHTAQLLSGENISFLFVGDGAERKSLQEMTAERGLKNVIFVGRKRKSEMPSYWVVCDVGLVHLKKDPLFETVIPSKIFESMAMGKPVVYVGPEGVGSAIIRENHCGICVPPADPEGFADALRTLSRDNDLYRDFERNCVRRVGRYSRERQAENTLNVLKEAASI